MTVPVYFLVSIFSDFEPVSLLFHVYIGVVYVVKLSIGQRHVHLLARRASGCDGDRSVPTSAHIIPPKSKVVGIFQCLSYLPSGREDATTNETSGVLHLPDSILLSSEISS